MQTLELNPVCTIFNALDDRRRKSYNKELQRRSWALYLKSLKENLKIQYWCSHVLDYNCWLLRNFLKSWICVCVCVCMRERGGGYFSCRSHIMSFHKVARKFCLLQDRSSYFKNTTRITVTNWCMKTDDHFKVKN